MSAPPIDSVSEDDPWWKWLTGGWSKSAAILLFLVVAFYVEEDWRGANAWREAQAQVAAHGESLDPKKLIPPPIPDERNFGALPIFKLEPDASYPGSMIPTPLNNALGGVGDRIPYDKQDSQSADKLPYLGKWEEGEEPDLPAIQQRLNALGHRLLPSAQISPTTKPVEIFDLLCPALSDLREANALYPECRFNLDYGMQPALEIPLGGLTSQIKLAKVLSYEEHLAILNGKPHLAFEDFQIAWKINSGLQKEPLLIAGLVSAGVVAIQLGVIRKGLAEHVWNDQELSQLDADLGKMDYLANDQLCLRGEAIIFSVNNFDYFKHHRTNVRSYMYGRYSGSKPDKWNEFLFTSMFSLIPDGWFDLLKANYVQLLLTYAVQVVDPVGRRVYPERQEHFESAAAHSPTIPFGSAFSPGSVGSGTKRFAYAQVLVDEARIACRLERYHLVHGVYPDSLQALIPAYGADLPQDVMSGHPYRYKLRPDGNYLLYSVGWDQIDDNGDEGSLPNQRNAYAPDWVWINHPEPKKTTEPTGPKHPK